MDADGGTSLSPLATGISPSNYGPMLGKGNLAFSPDGSMLLEDAFKKRIYVWKLRVE